MDYSNFIILLARQRSGTNALRSVLETHPDIHCFDEVFNFADKDAPEEAQRESNFFNFIVRYGSGDVQKLFPDRHGQLFVDYLDYLRCHATKRFLIVDIKYNTTHFLSKPYLDDIMSPYLFELIKSHKLGVLHLERKHYLRYALSVLKAWRTRRYVVKPGDANYTDQAIRVDPAHLLRVLDRCETEDHLVERHFKAYQNYFVYEYANLFPDRSGQASPDFLQSFSSWLQIPNTFESKAQVTKQATLSLRQTLENYDEIAKTLQGTRFEYCLREEVEPITAGETASTE